MLIAEKLSAEKQKGVTEKKEEGDEDDFNDQDEKHGTEKTEEGNEGYFHHSVLDGNQFL